MFRDPIQLDNPNKSQDEAGGNQEISWDTLVITKGCFVERDGFRQMEEGFDQLVWEYEAFMWWRNEIEANVTKDTRLIYENRIYKIVSWGRWKGNRQFLRFELLTSQ